MRLPFNWSVERSDSSNALMLPELLRRIEEGRKSGEFGKREKWYRILDRLFGRIPSEPVALKIGKIHQCVSCLSFVSDAGEICFRCKDKKRSTPVEKIASFQTGRELRGRRRSG